MKIIYAKDYESMSRNAANIISAQVIINPKSVLGLATGSSPLGVYKQLIDWYNKGDIDFSSAYSVNLDEYVGLDSSSDQSYAYFMEQNFFKYINFQKDHTFVPNGKNLDAQNECARYNKIISDLGGIDLQLLGIGHNGHIGFNEPGAAFEKETHQIQLAPDTIEANARFFEKSEDVPQKAYTMGIKNIMNAKKILVIASGLAKADILYEAVFGAIRPSVPATILQLHNDVTIVADADALSTIIAKVPNAIERLPK